MTAGVGGPWPGCPGSEAILYGWGGAGAPPAPR